MNLFTAGTWNCTINRALTVGAIAAFMLWANYNHFDFWRDKNTIAVLMGASTLYDRFFVTKCTRKHVDD